MDTRAQTLQLQNQVRQNAEEYRNSLNDLYSWTKDIKEKEKNLNKSTPYDKNLRTIPIRGINMAKTVQTLPLEKELLNDSNMKPANIKCSLIKSAENAHMEANKVKDIGNAFVKKCEYEHAISAYTQAINIYANDVVYYCNRALCYLKLERFEECIEDCNHALGIDERTVKALYRRMQANESLGNQLAAFNDCKAVLDIEPRNKEAHHCLQRITGRLKKITSGPNFTQARENYVKVKTFDKPPCKRSVKPLVNIKVENYLGHRERMEIGVRNLDIPDDDVDKIFNSNCGPYVEVKNPAIMEDSFKKGVTSAVSLPKTIEKQQPILKKESKLPESIKVAPVKNREIAIPSNSAQFYSEWRDMNMEEKYNYLTTIDNRNLLKILGAGFDSDTLSIVLQIIRDYYLPNKNDNSLTLIKTLLKHQQIPILTMFLSKNDYAVLNDISRHLENKEDVSKADLLLFRKSFGLNE